MSENSWEDYLDKDCTLRWSEIICSLGLDSLSISSLTSLSCLGEPCADRFWAEERLNSLLLLFWLPLFLETGDKARLERGDNQRGCCLSKLVDRRPTPNRGSTLSLATSLDIAFTSISSGYNGSSADIARITGCIGYTSSALLVVTLTLTDYVTIISTSIFERLSWARSLT